MADHPNSVPRTRLLPISQTKDLKEMRQLELLEPTGWIHVPLTDVIGGQSDKGILFCADELLFVLPAKHLQTLSLFAHLLKVFFVD